MNPSRRGFLSGLIATAVVTPSIVSSANIMKVRSFFPSVLTIAADGTTDDTAAVQAMLDGEDVLHRGVLLNGTSNIRMPPGIIRITDTLKITGDGKTLSGGMFVCDFPASEKSVVHFVGRNLTLVGNHFHRKCDDSSHPMIRLAA